MYGISPHSFTRICKEMRDDGIPLLHDSTTPENGGTDYHTYYLAPLVVPPKTIPARQTARPCPVCGSFYVRGDRCNVCGVEKDFSFSSCIATKKEL
jgi:hypothetical protein